MVFEPRNNVPVTRGRPFKKGNPGRPKGSRNKTTIACENLLAGEAKGLTRKVIELAYSGDSSALRLCMERIYPVRKGSLLNFALPRVDVASDIVSALGVTVDAVFQGEITPDEASALAGLLETKRKAIETVEIERRIEALERRGS